MAESSAKPKVPSRSRRQRVLRRARARRGAAPLTPGPAAAGAALRRRRGCLSSPEARARAQLMALQKGGAPPPGPCGARRGRHAESAPRMLTRSGFAQNAAKSFSSSTARVGAGGASPSPPFLQQPGVLTGTLRPAPPGSTLEAAVGSPGRGPAPAGLGRARALAAGLPRSRWPSGRSPGDDSSGWRSGSAGGWRWDLPLTPRSWQVRAFSRVVKGVDPPKGRRGLN